VVLEGPSGNPHGLGAVLRAWVGDRAGPSRQAHGASGYGSQDAPVLVFAASEQISRISVLWPGGSVHEYAVPAGAAGWP
jgi:hypothetical protein